MPFCRLPRLGAEGGCQNVRAADGALAAAGRLPPRGSESRARYHTGAHHSSCVTREVLTVAWLQGELQAAWPPHTSDGHCGFVCVYSWLLARSVAPFLCHVAPFGAMKHCSDPSAGGWGPGDRHALPSAAPAASVHPLPLSLGTCA